MRSAPEMAPVWIGIVRKTEEMERLLLSLIRNPATTPEDRESAALSYQKIWAGVADARVALRNAYPNTKVMYWPWNKET